MRGMRPRFSMMVSSWCWPVLAALAAGAVAIPARAQVAKLRQVEQGVADRGPLSSSQRVLPIDLGVPSGFDRVYRLGGPRSGGMFARISGGITAVFPRSQYTPTPDGYAAETPAGTVYYIGRLPSSLVDQAEDPRHSRDPETRPPGFADRSARRPNPDRASTASPSSRPITRPSADGKAALRARVTPVPPEPRPEPTIFTDEFYRGRRVAELLDAARAAPRQP